MKAKLLLFALLALGLIGGRAQAQEMYARGTFNDWGTWHKMVLADTAAQVWEAKSVYLTSDTLQMKFANSSDWSGDDWGGGNALADTAVLTTGGGENSKFFVADAGFYDLVFNQVNLSYRFTLTPFTSDQTLMYARGSFNAWGTGNRMYLIANHLWKTTVSLDANGYQMKFANHPDWAGKDWGNASGLSGSLSETTGGGPDMNFVISAAGCYDILFNDSSLTYEIKPSVATAVEEVIMPGSLHLFPNPVQQVLHIEFTTGQVQGVPVRLFDLNGRLLHEEKTVPGAGLHVLELNMASWAPGTYLLRAGQENRLVIRK